MSAVCTTLLTEQETIAQMVGDCTTVIFTVSFCARNKWYECDAGKTIAVHQKLN
ncbi:MAG TPA: hypothetical protein V6D34_04820 [Candidatus Sericytochromatia bacterium]